jgi:hypothetical protein
LRDLRRRFGVGHWDHDGVAPKLYAVRPASGAHLGLTAKPNQEHLVAVKALVFCEMYRLFHGITPLLTPSVYRRRSAFPMIWKNKSVLFRAPAAPLLPIAAEMLANETALTWEWILPTVVQTPRSHPRRTQREVGSRSIDRHRALPRSQPRQRTTKKPARVPMTSPPRGPQGDWRPKGSAPGGSGHSSE